MSLNQFLTFATGCGSCLIWTCVYWPLSHHVKFVRIEGKKSCNFFPGLLYKKTNRKSHKLFPLSKMAENLPSASIPLTSAAFCDNMHSRYMGIANAQIRAYMFTHQGLLLSIALNWSIQRFCGWLYCTLNAIIRLCRWTCWSVSLFSAYAQNKFQQG